ncbi:natural cytotoxicity triggering receptor 1-like isoform 3-T3 [Thomomys bottae]
MLSRLPALLWMEPLWKPAIWAKPSHLVPVGSRVEIWCRGPRDAVEFQLHFEGSLHAVQRTWKAGKTSRASFPIQLTTQGTAGQYRCLYSSGELWSDYSDPLDLVVTGLYDTPTLSVYPGPQVALGEPVTFCCRLETATTTFFLLKKGWPRHQQRRKGVLQAEFSMGPATLSHRGTYQCFGSYNDHLWSFPSKPVTLAVTGDVENASLATTDPPASSPAQNLVRIGLGLLVVVALAWLVAEDQLLRKRVQAGARGCGHGRRRRTAQQAGEGRPELRSPGKRP